MKIEQQSSGSVGIIFGKEAVSGLFAADDGTVMLLVGSDGPDAECCMRYDSKRKAWSIEVRQREDRKQ